VLEGFLPRSGSRPSPARCPFRPSEPHPSDATGTTPRPDHQRRRAMPPFPRVKKRRNDQARGRRIVENGKRGEALPAVRRATRPVAGRTGEIERVRVRSRKCDVHRPARISRDRTRREAALRPVRVSALDRPVVAKNHRIKVADDLRVGRSVAFPPLNTHLGATVA